MCVYVACSVNALCECFGVRYVFFLCVPRPCSVSIACVSCVLCLCYVCPSVRVLCSVCALFAFLCALCVLCVFGLCFGHVQCVCWWYVCILACVLSAH